MTSSSRSLPASIIASLLLTFCHAFAPGQTPPTVLIRHATIVDVENGKLLPQQALLIRRDSIIAAGADATFAKQKADKTIDASGLFLMPGLWDMHMHFGGGDTLIEENKWLLPLYLAHGVTTIRDCAADISDAVLHWRDEINNGQLTGPRIFTSGPKLEGRNSIWKGDLEVDNETELLQAFDSLSRLQVDFVKITDNTMKPALYLKALQTARQKGWAITGHIPASLSLDQVSEAGLSAVEHFGYLAKAGQSNLGFDTAAALQTYKRLAARKTAVVPTLNISRTIAYLDENDHHNDDYLQYIGKGLQRTYDWRVQRAAKDDAAAIARRHAFFEKTAGLLPLVKASGMTIIAGTDAGYLNSFDYPGIGLHDELSMYVHYGLQPAEALQASVVNGPAFFGLKQYGSLSKGKTADILFLRENPLININATRSIENVMKSGRFFSRKQLDEMLAAIAAKVKAGD